MVSRGSVAAETSTGLGRRIREARVTQGMTQGDLAGSDYSVGFISRIESGARQPSRHTLTTLAGRLAVSPEFLLTGAEEVDALARRHDLDRAELALAGGDIDEAIEITTALVENTDLSPWPDVARRARLVHALCYEALGDLHSAIIELEDLAKESGADDAAASVGIALSRCYRDVGDFAQAITSGEAVLRAMEVQGLSGTTEHVRLSMTVAGAYFETGEVGVATRMARRAIKAAEANAAPEAQAAAYWNASMIERECGRLERAVELASKALSILETGNSTRNLARFRTQLALTQLRNPHSDADEIRAILELAGRELDWSAASPVDHAHNVIATARLALRDLDPVHAQELLDSVPAEICHQDPLLSAEVNVVRVMAMTVAGERIGDEFASAAALLDLMGPDRGVAQMWFELGEAADAAGQGDLATRAFRQAAVCLGAARILLPIHDRPAFRLPSTP